MLFFLDKWFSDKKTVKVRNSDKTGNTTEGSYEFVKIYGGYRIDKIKYLPKPFMDRDIGYQVSAGGQYAPIRNFHNVAACERFIDKMEQG